MSLLGDVTSPTTVAHYVSMTCSDKRRTDSRAESTVYRNKGFEFTNEQVGRLRYVTAVDGALKRFPSVALFAQPWPITFRLFVSLIYSYTPAAVYDGCGSAAFVYWLRLKQM